MVTTLSPAPGCDAGAISVILLDNGVEDTGGGPNGGLAGPVPDEGEAEPAAQLPLEPTLRTGRGGTLGIGLF
jgi:hypothetical protein